MIKATIGKSPIPGRGYIFIWDGCNGATMWYNEMRYNRTFDNFEFQLGGKIVAIIPTPWLTAS